MKTDWLVAAAAAAIPALAGSLAPAQDRRNRQGHTRFDEHSQQVKRDWHNQNSAGPAAGMRNQDRLSAGEESRLLEGATLDNTGRLLPRPSGQRYVATGGHVGLVDSKLQVKAVIHFHENH